MWGRLRTERLYGLLGLVVVYLTQNGKAIAVVSQQPHHCSPGIDIEVFSPAVIQESENVFTTKTERNILKASSIQYELALLVTFSVKESLYKSLYPTVRRYFGFDAVKICSIDNRVGRVSLELTQNLTTELTKGTKFSGPVFVSREFNDKHW